MSSGLVRTSSIRSLQALLQRAHHCIGGERDDRRLLPPPVFQLADAPRRFQSVHDRHLHVHQYERVQVALECFDRLPAVADHLHIAAEVFEEPPRDALIDRVVFDEQHLPRVLAPAFRRRPACRA